MKPQEAKTNLNRLLSIILIVAIIAWLLSSCVTNKIGRERWISPTREHFIENPSVGLLGKKYK